MKNRAYLSLLAAAALIVFICSDVNAQGTKTIILVRHAEKFAPIDTDRGDPDLTPEGRQRAERLMRVLRKYKTQEIFATEYKRTIQTAEPIAKLRKIKIQTYDPATQADLAKMILASKTRNYLIVGHSNSIPALANMLLKKEVFRQLLATEYGVFWVIRLNKGVVAKVEVFPY